MQRDMTDFMRACKANNWRIKLIGDYNLPSCGINQSGSSDIALRRPIRNGLLKVLVSEQIGREFRFQ